MIEVSKASAYPKSVQPGVPRLGATPPGWSRGPLSEHLFEEVRPVKMVDEETYDLVTVKRSRGGVVLRERLKGKEIAVKSQFRLKAGDFLISKRQIVHGACGIVPPELDDAIVSNEYAVLRARPSLNLEFLNYLAQLVYFQQTCFHSSIGVHVEKMIFKLDRWLQWEFNIPPTSEQDRICEVLRAWDAARRGILSRIVNAKTQRAALCQQILQGKRRLEGFDDQWNWEELGALCDTFSGGTPSRNDPAYYSGTIPWIKSGELNSREIFEADEYISEAGLSNSSAKLVPPDTVLIAMYGATAGVVATSKIEAAINQAVLAVRPGERVDNAFLKHCLTLAFGNVRALTQGAQPNLNAQIIRATLLPVPSKEEQAAISAVLDVAEKIELTLTQSAHQVAVERIALIQQLLTGKRRRPANKRVAA